MSARRLFKRLDTYFCIDWCLGTILTACFWLRQVENIWKFVRNRHRQAVIEKHPALGYFFGKENKNHLSLDQALPIKC